MVLKLVLNIHLNVYFLFFLGVKSMIKGSDPRINKQYGSICISF
uniref:Uncharacterized protein n=1 Tax=Medicago truncatula TaxID=3880 RepID=I3T8W5_MEDTR|nr:unknown [Medicago truncatula]